MVDSKRNTNNQIDVINSQYGKIPPQAIDLENSVLGSIISEPENFPEITGILKEESFYKENNRLIFSMLSEMYFKSIPIDLLSITQYLRDFDNLEKIGGALYITQIFNSCEYAGNVFYHARIIQQKFIQRELIRIGIEISNKGYDDSEDISDLLDYAQKSIENIDQFSVNEGKNSKQVATEAINEISEDCQKVKCGKQTGIPTGFLDLNKATGGWKSPYFIILGARPGEGKTTMALHFAITAAKAGFWVNFYSYEMIATDLFKIAISGESGVNRTDIRDGYVSDEDWKNINTSLRGLTDLKIIWYDNPDIKTSQIRHNTRKNKLKGKCDFVIVDYLQLMPAETKTNSREQVVSDISRSLKKITTGEKIPLIALSQLNRDVEKRPNPEVFLSDLRESGALEQDADLVMFQYSTKDEELKPIDRFLKIAKQRRGNIGIIKYRANVQMTKMFDKEIEGMVEYPRTYNPNQQFKPNMNFDKEPF